MPWRRGISLTLAAAARLFLSRSPEATTPLTCIMSTQRADLPSIDSLTIHVVPHCLTSTTGLTAGSRRFFGNLRPATMCLPRTRLPGLRSPLPSGIRGGFNGAALHLPSWTNPQHHTAPHPTTPPPHSRCTYILSTSCNHRLTTPLLPQCPFPQQPPHTSHTRLTLFHFSSLFSTPFLFSFYQIKALLRGRPIFLFASLAAPRPQRRPTSHSPCSRPFTAHFRQESRVRAAVKRARKLFDGGPFLRSGAVGNTKKK